MLELRERNGKKNFLSEDELTAFAWAGYYTNCSTVFVNGEEYEVVHVTDSAIEFSDGTSLPVSCYSIFKNDKGTRFFDDYWMREIRKENPLEHHNLCFTDEQFYKSL